MQPQFVTKPAFTVVGMAIHTRPMTDEIPQLWGQFAPRMDEIARIAEPMVSYGLMENPDGSMERLDYMAAVSVTEAEEAPPGMTVRTVPGNTYAVFTATLATIGEVFGHIYHEWLPSSGYVQATGPYFERYGETFNPDVPGSPMEIYIPVVKRAS